MLKYLILASLTIPTAAYADCPVEIGQNTSFQQVDQLQSTFGTVEAKGEFETTAQYEERRSKAASKNNETIILENTTDFKYVQYDADEQRFEIYARAFGDESPGWILSTKYASIPNGVEIDYDQFNMPISEKDLSGSTYSASNAYGATVTVDDTSSEVVVIYDGRKTKSGKSFWEAEAKVRIGDSKYKTDAFFLKVPLADAPKLKETLRWGVAFTPRPPFSFETTRVTKPTISRPKRHFTTFQTLVGDISCAFLTDGDGKVLKIVMPK